MQTAAKLKTEASRDEMPIRLAVFFRRRCLRGPVDDRHPFDPGDHLATRRRHGAAGNPVDLGRRSRIIRVHRPHQLVSACSGMTLIGVTILLYCGARE